MAARVASGQRLRSLWRVASKRAQLIEETLAGVFTGRLNPAAREKDAERIFKGYGRIRDIDLKRGFGFVEFENPRDADDAVYELDGKELCSQRVTIEHARARGGRGRGQYLDHFSSHRPRNDRRNAPPVRTENRLIVENLSSRVSWQDLKDFMRQGSNLCGCTST